MKWNKKLISENTHNYSELNNLQQHQLLDIVNNFCSYQEFTDMVKRKVKALQNMEEEKKILDIWDQSFPKTIDESDIDENIADYSKIAFMFTAGGEGERLRESLKKEGYCDSELNDFTKATFPIPNFKNKFGPLQINLSMINKLSERNEIDIPVIVTTGPKGSTTERVIPNICKEFDNFGLKQLKIIAQNERLHLTTENKIAWKIDDEKLKIATNPDETGGPIVAFFDNKKNREWLKKLNVQKIILIQGTALYDIKIFDKMVAAANKSDGFGVAVGRKDFESNDPFGSYVNLSNNDKSFLKILEKGVRNSTTEKINDKNGNYLPFNTGFYCFPVNLFDNKDLVDYATPPKIIFDNLKAEKIGFSATDIISLLENPIVLTINQNDYAVIKESDDLNNLKEVAEKFRLEDYC